MKLPEHVATVTVKTGVTALNMGDWTKWPEGVIRLYTEAQVVEVIKAVREQTVQAQWENFTWGCTCFVPGGPGYAHRCVCKKEEPTQRPELGDADVRNIFAHLMRAIEAINGTNMRVVPDDTRNYVHRQLREAQRHLSK